MTYGVNEIAELFPSLMEIKDESLREKVAAVWNEAITTGCGGKGWTFDELRAVKFTLLAGDIEMTFVEHLNSCARQCIAVAEVLEKSFHCGIPIQRDYLIAGSLLADVGKPLEYDKDASGKVVQGKFGQQVRHPFSGVALAYKHGIPGEVLHIIATHSHEATRWNARSSRSFSITPISSTSTSPSFSASARRKSSGFYPRNTRITLKEVQ